jgi:hypothetical protein
MNSLTERQSLKQKLFKTQATKPDAIKSRLTRETRLHSPTCVGLDLSIHWHIVHKLFSNYVARNPGVPPDFFLKTDLVIYCYIKASRPYTATQIITSSLERYNIQWEPNVTPEILFYIEDFTSATLPTQGTSISKGQYPKSFRFYDVLYACK